MSKWGGPTLFRSDGSVNSLATLLESFRVIIPLTFDLQGAGQCFKFCAPLLEYTSSYSKYTQFLGLGLGG